MPSHRDNPELDRPHAAASEEPGRIPAQTISPQTYQQRPPAPENPSAGNEPSQAARPELQNLLTALKAEVTMAAGIAKGLGDTLAQLQEHIAAIDEGIAPNEVSQVQAAVLRHIAHLQTIVTAASDDMRHVMPDRLAQILDVARPDHADIIFS